MTGFDLLSFEPSSSQKETAALERPRILLADDHRAMLDREVSLLQSSFEIVGIVNDGRALIGEAHRLQPDVIVLDISMPIMTGIEAAHELIQSGSTAKLVFLTVHQEAAFVHKCFSEGGIAYVIKSRMVTDLIPAINEALSDHSFVSPSVVH